MKIGLLDVGGGMRGSYATGILDVCLEKGINFDCCIGLSAGSLNLTTFLAGQKGRNYRYYFDYAFRKEYCGIGCFLKKGDYLNLEFLYETLANSDGEDPLDYDSLMKNETELFIVAEECESGETKYFTKADLKKDNYKVLSASCNIPLMNKPVKIDGISYYDGGFADPLPIQKALDEGCEKVVLILTRPIDIPRNPKRDRIFSKLLKIKYPKAAERLAMRAERYNKDIEFVKKLQKEDKIYVLSPKDVYGLDTLTRDKESMQKLYKDGRNDAEGMIKWIEKVKKIKS